MTPLTCKVLSVSMIIGTDLLVGLSENEIENEIEIENENENENENEIEIEIDPEVSGENEVEDENDDLRSLASLREHFPSFVE